MGILLGVASLVLYQSAYAATRGESPYPGPISLPGIPPGPSLGCNPVGHANQTWVCGFNALSHVTFKVNGRDAGTAPVESSGCVLVVLAFRLGAVQVNGNAFVPVHPGTNYLVVEGKKTTSSGTYVVGLRLRFEIPHGTAKTCVITPPVTTSTTHVPVSSVSTSSSTSTSTTIRRPRVPKFTTSTRYNPTTLAKAIESPLQISPNKVILETSLLAAVLAAVLSAGALGSMWSASARAEAAAGAAGTTEEGGGESGAGGAPTAPEPPPAPAGGGGAVAGGPTATTMTSAFARPSRRRTTDGAT